MRTVLLSLLIASTVFLRIATAGPGQPAAKSPASVPEAAALPLPGPAAPAGPDAAPPGPGTLPPTVSAGAGNDAPPPGPEPAATGAAGEKKTPLTPEEIFHDGVTGQVCVEFTVKAVAIQGSPFSMEEAVGRQPVANADGKSSVSRLVVIVSEKVETRLHQLGIEDLRTHFYGKTVRVAGNLKLEVDAGGIGNRLITYSLTIDDLDQLRFVGRKAPRNDAPPKAGSEAPPPGPGPFTPRT
jgi:hypothetical protein